MAIPLLHIAEPGRANDRPDMQAFLEMGFRPLYLAGGFWAAVSLAIWIFAPQWIGQPLGAVLPGVVWHAHEMLWGFVATIAVAFLMTAGANWTGMNPMQGRLLGFACVLWVVPRIAFLLGGQALFWLGFASELAFFALAALALSRAVLLTRNKRNYAVPWMLLLLGITDAFFLAAAQAGDYTRLMQHFNAGLLCMAVVTLLVARRVIPFFAMRAVSGLEIPMHLKSGMVQLVAGSLAILFALLHMPVLQALCLTVAGGIGWVQLLSWKPWAVVSKPMLWILYLGYGALAAGLLVAAAHAAGLVMRAAIPVHIVAVGGFSVLIIGMMTRTALGHLGRALALDRWMLASHFLMVSAVALRLFALWPSAWSLAALHASSLSWIACFSIYLWRFTPLMIRPRADAPTHRKIDIRQRART